MSIFLAFLLSFVFTDVAATGGKHVNVIIDQACESTIAGVRDETGDCHNQ